MSPHVAVEAVPVLPQSNISQGGIKLGIRLLFFDRPALSGFRAVEQRFAELGVHVVVLVAHPSLELRSTLNFGRVLAQFLGPVITTPLAGIDRTETAKQSKRMLLGDIVGTIRKRARERVKKSPRRSPDLFNREE